MIALFPDQQEALARVLEAYHARPVGGKALIVAATGWGKTIWFSALIKAIGTDKPVLIVAHRDELLDQARDKIHMVDPTLIVGKVGGGAHDYGAPITVAGIDTISGAKHLKNLCKFGYGVVIIDECHHAPAAKYQKVLEALPDVFRVGVTATDKRLDEQSLEPIFGPALFRMNIIDAIKAGRLCTARGFAIRTETTIDASSKKNINGDLDFNQQELDLAVNTPARNRRVVDAYQEYAAGKRAICFAVSVAHAESLAYTFNDHGIPAAVVTGKTLSEERKKIYEKLKSGEIKVLTNVEVLTEGFDIPLIECVLMARPTQSWRLYIQCIGRGLRLAPDKKECLILDLTDNILRHKLAPQDLKKAINLDIRDGESVDEALAREEQAREAREKETQIRKLTSKRLEDLQINMFETIAWKEHEQGHFSIELPGLKHKLAIVPTKQSPGLYFVAANIAIGSTPIKQKWSDYMSLEQCQALAESRAIALINDPASINLFDTSAPWRSQKIDMNSNQVKALKWHKIPFDENMTKGEASVLMDNHKQEIERKKAVREARKQQKQKQNEVAS